MDAIGAVGPAGVGAGSHNRFSQLSSEEFMRIITTELSQQDPLQPSDTGSLIEQFSNLRSIQADTDLSDRLNQLVRQGEMSASATLMGQTVSGIDEEGARVHGRVVSVWRTADGPVLGLEGGVRLPFVNLDLVQAQEAE